jgi:hypothetical protein
VSAPETARLDQRARDHGRLKKGARDLPGAALAASGSRPCSPVRQSSTISPLRGTGRLRYK